MKEGKTVKFNLHSHQQQQQHANGGHLSPFKFAKLLDPDASWDKVTGCRIAILDKPSLFIGFIC